MNAKEALNIVSNAAYAFHGTRKDHEVIAQALEVLGALVPKDPVPQEAKEEVKR